MQRLLALVCFLTIFLFPARSTHFMGNYITYEQLDSSRYVIKLSFYRDCRGVPFANPSAATSIGCSSGGSVPLSLALVSIEEVTPLHPDIQRCSPANTYGTGDGVELHIYADTIDLSDSMFAGLTCCELIIQTGQCCRPGNINTGAGNQNFYNYALLNQCLDRSNSGPVIDKLQRTLLACNIPQYFRLNARDTVDDDSLAFRWGEPLRGLAQPISYLGGYYGYNHPFQVYYPGTFGPPYYNTRTVPPIGIFLDPETGQITMTPTRCDEVTVAVIEVLEYRKDSSGTPQQIGLYRFDHLFRTIAVMGNHPPELIGDAVHRVCEGEQLCFELSTYDETFVPPPPDSLPPPDTLSIGWDASISGAQWTVLDPDSLHPRARFCWTPPVGSARQQPYAFWAYVDDGHRPMPIRTERMFSIRVQEKDTGQFQWAKGRCGTHHVKWVDGSPRSRVEYSLWDSSGLNRADTADIRFSNGEVISNSNRDSFRVWSAGAYVLKAALMDSNYCPYDTVIRVHADSTDLATVVDIPQIMEQRGTLRIVGGDSVHWYSSRGYLGFSNSINPDSGGQYWAVRCDSNGCCSEPSLMYMLRLGLQPLPPGALRIYPNPANGSIRMELSSAMRVSDIRIVDMNGRTLTLRIWPQAHGYLIEWDAVPGIYMLEALTDQGVFHARLQQL